MYAKTADTTAVFSAFPVGPRGHEAADRNSMRSSNLGTAILHEQHLQYVVRYLLFHPSGTTAAARPCSFDKLTLSASTTPGAPAVAPLGLRGATLTYKDPTRSNVGRALCKKNGDTVSLTGAAWFSSFLQIGGNRALTGNAVVGLTRALKLTTNDCYAGVSDAVYSVLAPVSVKRIAKRIVNKPQAVVSLTETLVLPSVVHYPILFTQAVVPPTGTTPQSHPPPPPPPEPYTTGQTR